MTRLIHRRPAISARISAARLHFMSSAAVAFAALIVTQPAVAQEAPPGSGAVVVAQEAVTLPEIEVVTQAAAAKPKAKAPRKQAAKAKASPKPATAQPAPDAAPEPLPSSPGEANEGSPSADAAPVLGGSGNPGAQTVTSIDSERLENEPVFSAADLLRQAPGVSIKQGNGPRDQGISIRGSNARNGFAIRNVVIMEDGFPVTQPDGLSRSDLIDPHAYGAVDVWRGPSSALFGNYATGGALNFRLRRGRDIDGVEYGSDVGSNGYFNNYVISGVHTGPFEASVFMSDVRGDGHYEYSAFDTQTINLLMTYQPSSSDRFTFKAINNELDTELPFRMSLNQFRQNPFQEGCRTAVGATAGCVTNNFSGVPQTAEQAGANRDDRRSIFGARWEHRFDADTDGRVQVVLDDRDISQPTGTTSSEGRFLSYNVMSDLTHRARIAGLPATYTLATFWNHLPVDSDTYRVAPGGNARLGTLQSNTVGSTTNFGARFRQEVELSPALAAIAGATVERTQLEGTQRSYNAAGTLTGRVAANREITNVAPEVGLLYRPNGAWQYRGRIGTGYGTPQFSNLFVTPVGEPGNNTDLQSQTNVGFDLGADWTPTRNLMFSVTGFYEFFRNELVSQATNPGSPFASYTFNAPASEHRGVEIASNAVLYPGLRWTAAYLFNDQIYTEYEERLAGSAQLFDRAGNKIPGISPHELTTRLAYDHPAGPFKGVGAFVEYQWHSGFYMENANLLEAPGYELVNLNFHYKTEFANGPMRELLAYFEIRNLLDETYISSANNLTGSATATPDTLANVSGSIYAGAPRTYYGGIKVKF
jgi:iron complex outermembrane receptor protein